MYRLFKYDAHLLLQHQTLIEITHEYNYFGLTATPQMLKHLSVSKEYVSITPSLNAHLQRKLYINKLMHSANFC